MSEMFLIKKNTTKEDTLLSTLSALTNEIQRHMTLQRGGGGLMFITIPRNKKDNITPEPGFMKKETSGN